jgi:hypothetical protein
VVIAGWAAVGSGIRKGGQTIISIKARMQKHPSHAICRMKFLLGRLD